MSEKKFNEHTIQKDLIDRLNNELQAANEHILYLQNELDKVSSLKRHMKTFARKKISLINTKIERKLQADAIFIPVSPSKSDDLVLSAYQTDVENLDAFNRLFSTNKSLRVYRRAKLAFKRTIRKVVKQ